MKSINQLVVLVAFMLSLSFVFGQVKQGCNIVDGELDGVYVGKCKDGLANGKGTLSYTNPEGKYMFVGEFKKGKMHGEGQLFVFEGIVKKLLKEGIWKKGVYKGKKKSSSSSYQVKRKTNVDRYSVSKMSDGPNRISFKFLQSGQRNSITNLRVNGDSGTQRGNAFDIANSGYDGFSIPFNCKISYTTLNKMRSVSYDVEFEFVLNEPGVWQVTLNN